MSIRSLVLKASRLLGCFGRSQRGNVAITFAFATLPLIGFVGAAIDYSRANTVKTAMQAALDTTALMLSKEAASDTAGQLQTNAQKYFAALFTRPEAQNAAVTASYTTTGGSTIVVNGSVQVPTTFMGIIGLKTFDVNASSTAKWGSTRLRVALVLDNTGSMSQSGKMTALKTATKGLLTQLQNAAGTDGDVYVSIVPFVKDVNLGASNYNANWIYWGTLLQDPTLSDNFSWEANNGTCTKSSYRNRRSCLSRKGIWKPASHSTWNGCVMDRGDPTGPSKLNYDTNVASTNALVNASLFAAEQYWYCPQAAMGLNYNWTAMTSLVNNMSPAGNTNQGIGLALGWMSLTGGGPFTAPPKDPNYQYNEIIILMTDGLNTENRWYTSQSQIDARQKLTCDNVKAAGITLYTIQVNTGGDPTSTLLQNCASSSDKFFLLTSANAMIATFNKIGTQLTQLRVAK